MIIPTHLALGKDSPTIFGIYIAIIQCLGQAKVHLVFPMKFFGKIRLNWVRYGQYCESWIRLLSAVNIAVIVVIKKIMVTVDLGVV